MNNISVLKPIVSVEWLYSHFNNSNLLIFDASMDKVTSDDNASEELQIPNSQFFDIKNVFSDTSAPFPNTVPSAEEFTKETQNLGVNSDSAIVVYDDKGIYSSARAWYLFKSFGFVNIAVLDGGLPKWKEANYPLENKQTNKNPKGNFVAKYNPDAFKFFNDIQELSKNNNYLIIDARSANRFKGITPEPRKGLRSGTIPNSVNIPFTKLLDNGQKFKTINELQKEFDSVNVKNRHLVFSCGSGITACVLALGAELTGKTNYTVYDGSWTEYGLLTTE